MCCIICLIILKIEKEDSNAAGYENSRWKNITFYLHNNEEAFSMFLLIWRYLHNLPVNLPCYLLCLDM